MTERDRKLAELVAIATGVRYGMAAFDERLAEMGPGPAGRGNGPGSKGAHSSPVEGEVLKPAVVVTSQFDRLVARAHAAMLDLEAAYGEIARTQPGRPIKGEPSCAWCQEAVQAAAKIEQREGKAPIPLDYRSRTYLFVEERKGDKVVGKALVCEWCYRFEKRHGRKPTIEERWVHAQGGKVLVAPKREPKRPVPPRLRVSAK